MENSVYSYWGKKKTEKCSEENTKDVAETLFDKEICMGVNHKYDQSLQKKPGRDEIIPAQMQPGLRKRNER